MEKNFEHCFLIDESGNPAYDRLPTETNYSAGYFFNLGSVYIKKSDFLDFDNFLKNELKEDGEMHFVKYYHFRRIFTLKKIKQLPFVAFGVISNKTTLNSGKKNYDPENYQRYYHKNLAFLFERFNSFIRFKGINKDDVCYIIEENNAFNLKMFKRYIEVIKKDKKYQYNCINTNNIFVKGKTEKLLGLADIVACSLYNITDGNFVCGTQIIETRYFKEIAHKFYRKGNSLFNGGLKLVHKLDDLKLPDEGKNCLISLENFFKNNS